MALRERGYARFSADVHGARRSRPLTATYELTFRCALRCPHCYTGCWNVPRRTAAELGTADAVRTVGRIADAGCLWLCLTGGDPLARADFPSVYAAARERGLLATIFSSLTASARVLRVLADAPPFLVETTLNAADRKGYIRMCGSDLFDRQTAAIRDLLSAGVPVKVKTLVTRRNLRDLPRIRDLVESFGLPLRPAVTVHPRLDGDRAPCAARLPAGRAVALMARFGSAGEDESPPAAAPDGRLFACGVGGDSFTVTPEGRMVLCSFLREPSYDLAAAGASAARGMGSLRRALARLSAGTGHRCASCGLRSACLWCPARALLERGNLRDAIPYYCRLARATAARRRKAAGTGGPVAPNINLHETKVVAP